MRLPQKLTLVLLLVQLPFISCQKEDDENCNLNLLSKAKTTLIAKAGPDQSIILPKDSVLLDGSQSEYISGTITSYNWSKISGPAFFNIVNATAPQTEVSNLVKGEYQFELTVTAGNGLSSKDTVQVAIYDHPVNSAHWSLLGYLPQDEFFFAPRYWFNGSNFLMGINNQVFAVSNKGGVWRLSAPNIWNKIGSFPEQEEKAPVVFSIDNKGYCLGTRHLWQYDPEVNLWQRKKDVPDDIKDAQVALAIQNKVYLVGGNTNHVMIYDPSADTYSPLNNFPGTAATTGFVVNGEGFCIGADGKYWKYEPTTDSWEQKASLPPSIAHKSGFSLHGYGYVMGDLNLAAYNHNQPIKVWRYDPKVDQWHEFEENYPGYGAYEINTVTMDNYVFVGIGYNNGDFNAIDFWRFY